MPKVCQLSGKKKSVGSNISHSNRHTKRTFEPNLQKKTLIDPATGAKVKVRISTRAQRTLLKNPSKFKAEITKIAKKQLKRASK